MALPDNSLRIPGFARADLGARWDTRAARHAAAPGVPAWTTCSTSGAWRESPYQFSHAYLFPLAPRTLRMSVQAEL